MPLPVFDGAPSTEVHEHYDAAGNLTGRTVVTRESDWDADARAWAIGLLMREAAECKRCGGDLNETLDYEWKWEPQDPLVCLRCVGLQEAQKRSKDHPQRGGMIHRVEKRHRPQPKKKQGR